MKIMFHITYAGQKKDITNNVFLILILKLQNL
jgi:hypothetical protein